MSSSKVLISYHLIPTGKSKWSIYINLYKYLINCTTAIIIFIFVIDMFYRLYDIGDNTLGGSIMLSPLNEVS